MRPSLSKWDLFFNIKLKAVILFCNSEKPAVQVIPRVMNVTEGSPVLLICKATGSPPPNVTWTALSSGEVYNGGQLRIKSVQRSDAGNYECSVNNGISRPVKDTAFLNVYCK